MDVRDRALQRLCQGLILGACLLLAAGTARAQQTIGYIDSDNILKQMPEYSAIQKKVDRLARKWRQELDERHQEVEDMTEEYQARELLYTKKERKTKRKAIQQTKDEVEQLRTKYFGPEGLLFTRQEKLMQPLQERILTAVETVAEREGYDYVFDKAGGEVLFMYASSEHNLSDAVLEELGIDVEQANNGD